MFSFNLSFVNFESVVRTTIAVHTIICLNFSQYYINSASYFLYMERLLLVTDFILKKKVLISADMDDVRVIQFDR